MYKKKIHSKKYSPANTNLTQYQYIAMCFHVWNDFGNVVIKTVAFCSCILIPLPFLPITTDKNIV